MSTWTYLEILNNTTGNLPWLNNIAAKKEALTKIAEEGNIKIIGSLIPFLDDQNSEIRNATCTVIRHLFKKATGKNNFYSALAHCPITRQRLDGYAENFTGDEYFTLLAISSLNSDGYLRQKAVAAMALAENPEAIEFLVYRLADWVEPVRTAASKALQQYMLVKYIDNLIANLPVFDWLQKVQRVDLKDIYNKIISFIVSFTLQSGLENFDRYPHKIRTLLARHIATATAVSSHTITTFLKDKHYLVRMIAVTQFDRLDNDDIFKLLRDKSPVIRQQILYRLKERSNYSAIVLAHLADESASIRYFARFTLQGSKDHYAYHYYNNLREQRQIGGSISGLAEVGATQYVTSITPFLYHTTIRYRKLAFGAIAILHKDGARRFAIDNLDSSEGGLRKLLIQFLATIPDEEILTKATRLYQGGTIELRKAMLILFQKINDWTVLANLITGTIDEDEEIRNLAVQFLEKWKIKSMRLFTTPPVTVIERAKAAFAMANKIHGEMKYFSKNPLHGMEVYFW